MNNYSQEKNFQESETPNEHNYSQEPNQQKNTSQEKKITPVETIQQEANLS